MFDQNFWRESFANFFGDIMFAIAATFLGWSIIRSRKDRIMKKLTDYFVKVLGIVEDKREAEEKLEKEKSV